MMPFFPTPYPDEILYSVLARYHIRAGNTSPKVTMQEVFGSKTATAIVDLPCNIQNLIHNMPPGVGLTPEKIMNDYTLLPFYAAFLPPDRVNKLKHSMCGNRGGDIYSRAGIMASSIVQNRFLKFCSQCAREDVLNYGEIYWHRFHQIPCVICTEHGIPLEDSKVLVAGFNKHEFTAANADNCQIQEEPVISNKISQHLLEFSMNVKYLLDNPLHNREVEWFRTQYHELLKDKGYETVKGQIYRKKLIRDFIAFYGNEFLECVQASLNPYAQTNWLMDMLHNGDRTAHPIRHLLLIRYLGVTISDIFFKCFEYTPFGKGPWICLNSAADHYIQPVVDRLEISYGSDNKEAIGTFSCDCGFIYTRSGKDQEDSDQYTYTRIKQYGPVWEEKLKEVVSQRLSLRETARVMGADPGTVRKYARRLGLQIYWMERGEKGGKGNKRKETKAYKVPNREQYRNNWLTLQKEYPTKGIKELRHASEKTYIWLYRNDKEWLKLNSPAKKYVYVNKRVDWQQRDQELLSKVKKIVQKMQSSDEKPKQICISMIGNELGVRALLQRHLDKLPSTMAYIESVTETDADFRSRRVNWAIKTLEQEGQDVKTWKIFKKAGIRVEFYKEVSDYLKYGFTN